MTSYVRGTSRTGRPWARVKARMLRTWDVCHLCGRLGADTLDHIVPVSLGGAVYDPSNLAPAHVTCNRQRGNRPIEVARAELGYSTLEGVLPNGMYRWADGSIGSRHW